MRKPCKKWIRREFTIAQLETPVVYSTHNLRNFNQQTSLKHTDSKAIVQYLQVVEEGPG